MEKSKARQISNNIIYLLEQKGMTTTDLAEKSGISRVSISHYINDHAYPYSYNLEKIAKALEVDPVELLSATTNIDESKILESIRSMRKIYPKDTLIIMNPNTYCGYNLETGKKMRLRIVEEEWKDD